MRTATKRPSDGSNATRADIADLQGLISSQPTSQPT